MVSMLAIRPKVCQFKPSQNDGFSRAIKICSTPSFRGEGKPETLCFKILRHEKITCKYEQKYLTWPNSSFPSPTPPVCYQKTASRSVRELW
jgi:hypothetical protein